MKVGEIIKKYEVIQVYQVHDHSETGICIHKDLKTKWFFKYMTSNFYQTSEEVANLLLLEHGSVPKIVEVIQYNQGYFVIMEFKEGLTLDEYARQHRLSLKDYLNLMISLTEVLEHVHCYGIVHGDIKGDNILVGPQGHVYLIDFGSSYTNFDSNSFTLESVGPERLLDSYASDDRSDIYSIGKTMDKLLSVYKDSRKLVYRSLKIMKIKKVIKKCLEVNPCNRYQSANEVKDALIMIK